MNNVNMANMPMGGGPVGPAMPMMNNGAVAGPSAPRPQQQQQQQQQAQQQQQQHETNRHLLNTYIYEYFLRNEMYDCARTLLGADPQIKTQDGPNSRRDENGNLLGNGDSMDVDSKDGVDAKRPDDLPQPSIANLSVDQPFLFEWFCLFWDMFNAQKGKSGNGQVNSYMNHTQNQTRLRHSQQQELMRQMRPDLTPQQQQMQMMQMQRNGAMGLVKPGNNLPRTAMANSQQNPNNMMQHMLQQQKQGPMQREPSDMDGNRPRPSSPGSADNAPSPSKRMRLSEGGPFNPAQNGMMPNGRPAGQGMPGQQQQFATFQNQSPAVQQKTIQTYAANLQQQQSQQMGKPMPNANGPPGQGSPMVGQAPDGATINSFYNAEGMAAAPPGAMRGPGGPNATQQAGGSNHALQDYQMQLMLLEQQNKKRLMMARQEQDGGNNMPMAREGGPGGPGGPGAPPGAAAPFQGASPQGARPGASPNPTDMKRGPQQMNPAGMGSPLPEGAQSRGSPNTMNFMGNQMDPSQAPHFMGGGGGGNMAGGPQMNGMRPPSSHPGQPPFNGPMNPQQQQMLARQQGQMAGQPGQQMQWQQQQQQQQQGQQGGPGAPNGAQMVPQGQTPQQVQGTPQQRHAAMPPPAQPAAAAAANARNTSSPQVSTAAPPTPSQSSKAAPKKKETKSQKDKRTAAQKKSTPSLNAAGATPVAEPAASEPEAPTPATPITPVNPQQQNVNRPGGPNAGPPQPMPNGQGPAPVPQQAAPMVPPADPNQNQGFNMDMQEFGLDFANPLATTDVLNDFDFDSFLHDNEGDGGGFDFSNPANFMDPEIET